MEQTNPSYQQQVVKDNLFYAAEKGNIRDAGKQFICGADMWSLDYFGRNILDVAVIHGRKPFVKYLMHIGFNAPQIVGRALILADCVEMAKVLAEYSPDCSVKNDCDFTAYEVMLRYKNYELIEAYKQCELPVPPLSPNILRYIISQHDLKLWSVAMGIKVPPEYYNEMESVPLYDEKKKKRVFKRIVKELSGYAA